MPRFFFHMESKRTQLADEEGKTLNDLAAAHDHAMHLIHRAMCHIRPEDAEGWMINVATRDGRNPLTVLFPRRCFGVEMAPVPRVNTRRERQ